MQLMYFTKIIQISENVINYVINYCNAKLLEENYKSLVFVFLALKSGRCHKNEIHKRFLVVTTLVEVERV